MHPGETLNHWGMGVGGYISQPLIHWRRFPLVGCSEGLSEIGHQSPILETGSITHLYCLSSLSCLTLPDFSGFLRYWYPNPCLVFC